MAGSSSVDLVSPSGEKLWAGGTWSQAESPHRGDCVGFQPVRPGVFPLGHAKWHHHGSPSYFTSYSPLTILSASQSLVDGGFDHHASPWLLVSVSSLTGQHPWLASPALGSFFLHQDLRTRFCFSIPAPLTPPPSPAAEDSHQGAFLPSPKSR